jgi:predicted unusual protein kinase regulating ubiquinone biosynthesis (AarF/ABC1/UbiB family)
VAGATCAPDISQFYRLHQSMCVKCRAGLRELFYGVYERDSDKCLDALETMGVLVGGDRTSVRRTADFFLNSFEERLAQQRAERESNPDSQNTFKSQRSKEDSKAKRKEV